LGLNQPETDVDTKWADVAIKRLDSLRSGKVAPVDGEQVFKDIRQRFDK
jgi:hypothetical protein